MASDVRSTDPDLESDDLEDGEKGRSAVRDADSSLNAFVHEFLSVLLEPSFERMDLYLPSRPPLGSAMSEAMRQGEGRSDEWKVVSYIRRR